MTHYMPAKERSAVSRGRDCSSARAHSWFAAAAHDEECVLRMSVLRVWRTGIDPTPLRSFLASRATRQGCYKSGGRCSP